MTALFDTPSPFVHEALSVSLDVLIKATVLIVLALLLNVLLRGHKRLLVRSALWNALLAGLVVLPAATATFPRLRVACLPALPDASAAGDVTPLPLAADIKAIESTTPLTKMASSDLAAAEASAPGSPQRLFFWLALALAIYLLGTAFLAIRLAVSLNAVRRLRQNSRPLKDQAWMAALAQWQKRLGMDKPVELATSPAINVPMAFGWLQPTVLIPEPLAGTLDYKQRDAVLLHELAHVHRRDYPWQVLLKLVQAAYWIHPLVWIAGRRVSALREQACDDLCAYHAATPQDYRATLVAVATRLVHRPAISLGIAMARTPQIAKRLERIDTGHRTAHCLAGRPARALVTMLALVSVAAIGPIELARRAAAAKSAVEEEQPGVANASAGVSTPAVGSASPAIQPPLATRPASAPAAGTPKFRCDELIYEFPEVWSGDIVEHTWIIHNDGDGVLEILEVKPTCGCTVAEFDKLIPPGGQGKITAKLNTRGLHQEVTKSIVVRTNDPQAASSNTHLKGKVKPRISMDPPGGVQFGQVPPVAGLQVPARPLKNITLTNNTTTPLKIELLEQKASPFTSTLQEVQPGQVYQLTVSADWAKLKEGPNFAQIRFKTGLPEEPESSVPANVYLLPLVQVMPPMIAVATPVATALHREVVLTYNGQGPMKITGVSASDPAIKVEAQELAVQPQPVGAKPQVAGQSWKLVVDIPQGWEATRARLVAGQQPQPPPAPIEIIAQTDVKERPEIRIRVQPLTITTRPSVQK